MSDREWVRDDREFEEWIRGRPGRMRQLLKDWPPLCVVKTRPGIVLLVPAPGVEGVVYSYYEGGQLGVTARLTIPHPEYGFGDARPGEWVTADVDPAHLVLVRTQRWTRADVERALA